LNRGYATVACMALSLLVVTSTTAHADRGGYGKVVDLRAEAGTSRAEHHHDWSPSTRAARWKMISSTKNPFGVENDYSYLRLYDELTGIELFRRPVPALTHIWVSPDSKYVVGLSNVKVWNPYQLVVFSRSGDRVLERSMAGVNWPGVWESVTNSIKWYKERVPQITVVEDGTTATLSIEDPSGVLRQFKFPAVR
jgi:hypothetical protein